MAPPALNPTLRRLPLEALTSAERNPKRHDLDGLVDSLRRFGFHGAVITAGDTPVLVAGHGRAEALRRLHAEDPTAPPTGITLADSGDWLVPALTGRFRTEAEAAAYLIADNRTVEVAGWNEHRLGDILADLVDTADGTDGIGITSGDLDRYLALDQANKHRPDPETPSDDAPDTPDGSTPEDRNAPTETPPDEAAKVDAYEAALAAQENEADDPDPAPPPKKAAQAQHRIELHVIVPDRDTQRTVHDLLVDRYPDATPTMRILRE